MKKLSIFLLALVGLVALTSCGKKEDKPSPTQTEAPTVAPTVEPTVEPTATPEPVVEDYASVLYPGSGWSGHADYTMTEIDFADLKEMDSEITFTEDDVKRVFFAANIEIKDDQDWKVTDMNTGKEYNGGHALKVGLTTKTTAWDLDEGKMKDSWAVTQWIPDPHTAHVMNLTPNTYYLPDWVETPVEGGNGSKWNDNPAVIDVAGKYHVVLVEFEENVATAENCNYAVGVYKPASDSVHVVGGLIGDWKATKTNGMTEISLEELATLSPEVSAKVAEKDVKSVYVYRHYELNDGTTWTASAVKNGEKVTVDGGYTLKAIDNSSTITYDIDEEKIVAVSSVTQWMPHDHDYNVETLTPDLLFMPKWVETAAAGEEMYGTWADNPVCIGHAGYYTVILVKYNNSNSFETPVAGLALVLEEKIMTAAEKACADADEGKTDPTTLTGTIVKVVAEVNQPISLIVDVQGIKFAVTGGKDKDAEGNLINPTTVAGLLEGKSVTLTGVIKKAETTVSEVTTQYVFEGALVEWVKENKYSLIGSFTGGENWTKDLFLEKNESIYKLLQVTFAADDEFKIRKNADWTVAFGYADVLEPNAELIADNGGNIKIVKAGVYTVIFNEETGKISIAEYVPSYGVIGSFNDWAGDVVMETTDGNIYTAEVTVAANAELKVRLDGAWATSFGADAAGTNVKIAAAGTYIVTLNLETKLVTVAAK